MAPRGRRAAGDEAKHNEDDAGASGARKSRKKSLPTLRDDNYAAWKVSLRDKAYAAGKAWMEIWWTHRLLKDFIPNFVYFEFIEQ